jgi:hypothetical protein
MPEPHPFMKDKNFSGNSSKMFSGLKNFPTFGRWTLSQLKWPVHLITYDEIELHYAR